MWSDAAEFHFGVSTRIHNLTFFSATPEMNCASRCLLNLLAAEFLCYEGGWLGIGGKENEELEGLN